MDDTHIAALIYHINNLYSTDDVRNLVTSTSIFNKDEPFSEVSNSAEMSQIINKYLKFNKLLQNIIP